MKTATISLMSALAWAGLASLALAQPAATNTGSDTAAGDAGGDTTGDGDEPQPMMGIELDDEAARGHFQVAEALFQTGRYIEAGAEFE